MGGLGNQMFQYAFARNLSLELETELYLRTSFFNLNSGVTPRKFSLNKFPNLRYKIFQESDTEILKNLNQNSTYRLTDSSNFSFIPFDFDYKSNYFLDGYWQTEKYFEKRKTEISNDFSFEENWKDEIIKRHIQLQERTISLHVRRSDYLTLQENHPVQKKEYYDSAIEEIGQYDYIFIFSDDIKWCKENFDYKNMIFIENQKDIEDLWMMSICNHNIIANSSFSWWSAWLNKNPNKKVIAPKLWFGQQTNIDASDIIPDEWIKI